jgi:predicted amidohydrolase
MFSVGFVQFEPVRYAVAENVATLVRLLAGVRADLLVLPELANSGYLYAAPEALAPYAEPGDGSGPFLAALTGFAAQTGGAIVAGFAERAPEGGLYNSAAAVDESGVLQVYRKTHLFAGEKDLFLPGDSGFRILEYRSVRIGMMVCFDWFFPESARALALRGAQIIAHPSNLVLPYCQTAMVTRCLENRVFAVTTNRYGTEELPGQSLTFTGASQLISPRGQRLLEAPIAGDCVLTAEIAPELADDKRVTARNDLFADRRPEMYA